MRVEHKERAHARLSASGATRWSVCTASPQAEESFPDSHSPHAAAGTWMHEWTEVQLRWWLQQITITQFNAQAKALDEAIVGVAQGMGKEPGLFLKEQKEAGREYLNYVIERIQAEYAKHGQANVQVLVEQRFDLTRAVPESFGTSDLTIVVPGRVIVIDLKGGSGHRVEAESNPQLRLYGLGAAEAFGMLFDFDEVEYVIVQPKRNHVSSETLSKVELYDWADNVIAPVARIAHTGEGATFVPGDHCGFCRAKAHCRARADVALAEVDDDYADPASTALLTDDALARIYPQLEGIVSWAKAVKEAVESRVLKGGELPGLKVVSGRSVRAIRDTVKARELLIGAGFPEATITEALPAVRPLLGLDALEKVVGKKQFAEVLAGVITKPPGKLTVVVEDDPRPAVSVSGASPEEDFA